MENMRGCIETQEWQGDTKFSKLIESSEMMRNSLEARIWIALTQSSWSEYRISLLAK